MAQRNDEIDYLDLELSLRGLPRELIADWMEEFRRHNRCITPEIKDDILYINSQDFITFLGYVDSEKISEIEQHRLKTRAKQEIERLLLNSLNSAHQYHYKWCLTALNSFELGRKRDTLPRKETAAKRNNCLPIMLKKGKN